MRRMLMVMTASVGMALAVCGVANAAVATTNFEPPFTTGTVNGQDGWKSAFPPNNLVGGCPQTGGTYDQAVVSHTLDNPLAFGLQSLRLSNACASGEFSNQTYSKPVGPTLAAAEDQINKVAIATFSFKAPDQPQPGLFISVSPDSFEGSRMSWIGLEDVGPTAEHPNGGTLVSLNDTPEVNGDFVAHDLGVLPRNAPHTIQFQIRLNPGVNNDLVRVLIDGKDTGDCFATWENYYRTAPEQAPPPNVNTPASIRSLQFRSSVPLNGPPGGGYLFDNVSLSTVQTNPDPKVCDLVIGKQADAPTVTAGGRVGYQITVRNRGGAIARNVWACDRVPAGTTFVSADRALRRLGRERCLVIPSLAPGQRTGFHLVLRVAPGARPGTLTNTSDITPIQPPGVPGTGPPGVPAAELPAPPSPAPPPVVDVPGTPAPPAAAAVVPVQVAKAIVKVRAAKAVPKATGKRPTRPGARSPRVTG